MGNKTEALEIIENQYQLNLRQSVDQTHLKILRKYGEKCDVITEVGFRGGISASAFLSSIPKKFTSIDWDQAPYNVDRHALEFMQQISENAEIDFNFIRSDILEHNLEPCDLLFLDGFHTYEHVFMELIKHSKHVSKFIVLHDTEEPTCPGMFNAIEDFLIDSIGWMLEERHRERPGLTVLKRTSDHKQVYSSVFIKDLLFEINHQKEIYYSHIDESGSSSHQWNAYILDQTKKFSDLKRWPLTNALLPEAVRLPGATELMANYF